MHWVFTYAIPLLGVIVVNGNSLTLAFVKQDAFKNVDFPELGFPIIPMISVIKMIISI